MSSSVAQVWRKDLRIGTPLSSRSGRRREHRLPDTVLWTGDRWASQPEETHPVDAAEASRRRRTSWALTTSS
eukprot:scaffold434_cov186-Pinguiococcus_pyrenoidosus.AAC.96